MIPGGRPITQQRSVTCGTGLARRIAFEQLRAYAPDLNPMKTASGYGVPSRGRKSPA